MPGGNFEIRQHLFQFESVGYYKAFALSSIASTLIEAGDREQALATLKQALEVAQKIENGGFAKASALSSITSALAKAGEIKQSLEVVQKIDDAYWEAPALRDISMTLATEPIPNRPAVRRMKTVFTPKEKEQGKQIVEAIQRLQVKS